MDQETIRVSAIGMIRNFGPDAYAQAMVNVEDFRKSLMPKDSEGVRIWLAIAAAIKVSAGR